VGPRVVAVDADASPVATPRTTAGDNVIPVRRLSRQLLGRLAMVMVALYSGEASGISGVVLDINRQLKLHR
jgi:hypothetical protein